MLIVQGKALVDKKFTIVRRNNNRDNQLEDEKKMEIELELNNVFCSLDGDAQADGNTCRTQALNILVYRELVVGHQKPFAVPAVENGTPSMKYHGCRGILRYKNKPLKCLRPLE